MAENDSIVAAEEDQLYIVLDECSPETQRPCEILVTYAQLEALAAEAGTDAAPVHTAVARGALTEQEARRAAEDLARQLPPDHRGLADAWIGACWGKEATHE
jgi:hypothetical protein